MKTRTLLILAVTCGLVILVAGGIQLLRLANQDDPEPLKSIGDSVQLGDALVRVDSYEVVGDAAAVTVTLSGVDDPDGLTGFTLLAPGAAVSVDAELATSSATPPCSAFTEAPVTCVLWFAATDLEGSDRQLVFQRAAEYARWRLA